MSMPYLKPSTVEPLLLDCSASRAPNHGRAKNHPRKFGNLTHTHKDMYTRIIRFLSRFESTGFVDAFPWCRKITSRKETWNAWCVEGCNTLRVKLSPFYVRFPPFRSSGFPSFRLYFNLRSSCRSLDHDTFLAHCSITFQDITRVASTCISIFLEASAFLYFLKILPRSWMRFRCVSSHRPFSVLEKKRCWSKALGWIFN